MVVCCLQDNMGSLQQQLVNAHNLLKHNDLQTALLQERTDMLDKVRH